MRVNIELRAIANQYSDPYRRIQGWRESKKSLLTLPWQLACIHFRKHQLVVERRTGRGRAGKITQEERAFISRCILRVGLSHINLLSCLYLNCIFGAILVTAIRVSYIGTGVAKEDYILLVGVRLCLIPQ